MRTRRPRGTRSSVRRAAARRSKEKFVMVLYVTGSTPLSMKAVQNLKNLCDKYLEGRHQINIIDLYNKPNLASSANIIAAPTMVKTLPLPVQRFVGDMSDHQSLLVRMRIEN